jgi:hypothetical protein
MPISVSGCRHSMNRKKAIVTAFAQSRETLTHKMFAIGD